MTAAQAAAVTGHSERTIRRWIKTGRLRADKTADGYRIAEADLAAVTGHTNGHRPGGPVTGAVTGQAPGPVTGHPPGHDRAEDTAALVGLVRDLQAQLLQTTAAAAMWQERARHLEQQLALPAPAPARPWWRFW